MKTKFFSLILLASVFTVSAFALDQNAVRTAATAYEIGLKTACNSEEVIQRLNSYLPSEEGMPALIEEMTAVRYELLDRYCATRAQSEMCQNIYARKFQATAITTKDELVARMSGGGKFCSLVSAILNTKNK